MKNLWYSLLTAVLASSGMAQILSTRIDASFEIASWIYLGGPEPILNASNPDFPAAFIGSFSATLDVPQSGTFYRDYVALSNLTLSPAQIGTTTFSSTNVGLSLRFIDGVLNSLTLGGVKDGVEGWVGSASPGPEHPSDFILFIDPAYPDLSGAMLYHVNGASHDFLGQLSGLTFLQTQLTPVPEPSTYAFAAIALLLGIIATRVATAKHTKRSRSVGE